ncbi:hypothetical protein GEMRC1_012329 [Eukaryota sp. GEM-RC1]
MSQTSQSTAGLGSTDAKGLQSWILSPLSGGGFLHRSVKLHHNVWSYVLLLVQFIQILGFVLRKTVFHEVFDLQPILQYVSLPVYSSWSGASGPALLLTLSVVILLLVALFSAVCYWNSTNSYSNAAVTIALRISLELVITILYIPLMSLFLSFIPCGRSFDPTGITFEEGITGNCLSSISLFYRSVALLGSVMLFCLALAWIVFYDDSPVSKRSFARSHNRFCFWYLISFTYFLVIFFILHSRFWLFRVSYLLVPIFLSYKLFNYVPFYKRSANCLQMSMLGIWIGTAIGFIINSLITVSNEK